MVPFALAAAGVCALLGLGILPLPVAVLLDVAAGACYLVALRSGLPHWPQLPWPRLRVLSGMRPAIVPLAGFVSASVVLAEQPGLPGVVLLPVWALLLLAVAPWLEVGQDQGSSFRWGTTALALLIISIPIPLFILAMNPSVPAVVRAVTVAAAVLIPTWRLVSLTRRGQAQAWVRAGVVAVVIGAAAGASVVLRVPIPLLPVALLMGWYGFAGVVSQRDGRSVGAFAVFVVVAAVMLAVAGPV
ncbi:MAG: hypothetical protein WB801_09620 [Candidatus Dormiibacterota bacterium]